MVAAERGVEGDDDVAVVPASDAHCFQGLSVEAEGFEQSHTDKGNDQFSPIHLNVEIRLAHLQNAPLRNIQPSIDLDPQSAAGHRGRNVVQAVVMDYAAMDGLNVPLDDHEPIAGRSAKVEFGSIAHDVPVGPAGHLLVDEQLLVQGRTPFVALCFGEHLAGEHAIDL